jgi:uncharacterized membrane protein YeaQ/YmgE (transglycosylase-associated protein family)
MAPYDEIVILFLILSICLGGLIIGALGRLVVPGPDPMGIGMTILVGIGGSIIGGVIGRLIWGPRMLGYHVVGIIVLEVAGAALLVYLLRGRRSRFARR